MSTNQALATNGGQADTANLITMIGQASRDPDVNMDKFERLIQVYKDLEWDKARAQYHKAMARAQSKMAPISADASNPQTKSDYASYAQLDRHLRPIYSKEGFALSFSEGETKKENYVRVLCEISHKDGFYAVRYVDMPADGKGAKGGDVMTKTHATGSAFTYGMRYLLKLIFNVAIGSEHDDDGNAAGKQGLDPKKIKQLNDAIDQSKDRKTLYERIKKGYGVDNLGEIPEGEFNTVLISINKIVRKEKEAANESH